MTNEELIARLRDREKFIETLREIMDQQDESNNTKIRWIQALIEYDLEHPFTYTQGD